MGNDNQKGKTRQDMLDDFWDLSELVPRRKHAPLSFSSQSAPLDTRGSEISKEFQGSKEQPRAERADSSSTVLKRYINPLHYEQKKIRKETYDGKESYRPSNSLLHEVVIRKRKSDYELYAGFLESALRYRKMLGSPAQFVSYYSYVPQYDQLTDEQLSYYLWWRRCFEEGNCVETTYSYVLLYVFEIINLGEHQDIALAQSRLCDVWREYGKQFVQLLHKLPLWVCDFSLLHKLPTPQSAPKDMLRHTLSLKEFYLNIPEGDYAECAKALIRYASEYDYKTSKFYKDANTELFDEHILGALRTAVSFYSQDGVMLSALHSEDSKLIRNAYEGALCCSAERYEIEVKYSSFSRSNELRYIVADIIKYAENKIRTHVGVKSKLTVYSVSTELQKAIDAYFEQALLPLSRSAKKKEEKHDYDLLYDLPKKEFSIENARKIESESWSVTNDLISAFEDTSDPAASAHPSVKALPEVKPEALTPDKDACEGGEDTQSNLTEKLVRYMPFINALKENNMSGASAAARECGMLADAIVDIINEIAFDELGDVLIEDNDGKYEILDCYLELL